MGLFKKAIVWNVKISSLTPCPPLFQTGYLTILKTEPYPGGILYTLGFPNHEVRYAFNNALLAGLSQIGAGQDRYKIALMRVLQQGDLDQLKTIFAAFFDSIPNDWYRKNDIAGYEGYYCSVVYCYFAALGLDVRPEESTNQGRIDMTVLFENKVYVIEFKVNELTDKSQALAQIREKNYHKKFAGRETYMIGVEFSKNERNISRFEWERVEW